MVRRLTYRDGRQKFTYAKLKAPGSCEGQMTKGMKEQAVEVVTTLRGKDTHSLSDTACHFCWKLREGSTQRWLLYLASCAESLAIFMIFLQVHFSNRRTDGKRRDSFCFSSLLRPSSALRTRALAGLYTTASRMRGQPMDESSVRNCPWLCRSHAPLWAPAPHL